MQKRFKLKFKSQLIGWAAILIFGAALVWLHYHPAQSLIEERAEPETVLNPRDRILILAPHPDDEVLGCAGIIQKARKEGVPVHVVLFTYGDNNEWAFFLYRKHPVFRPSGVRRMGLVRHDETLEAAKRLELSPDQLTFLGYPDFGTLNIWLRHWASRGAYRSMLTRVKAVPYDNALRPGAPYKGEEVLRDLKGIIRTFHPTKIFVSHPADYMPDHLALYLFTRVALWDLEREVRPELYPYLVHHGSWPQPSGYRPQLPLEPPLSLMHRMNWQYSPMTIQEIEKKLYALKAHTTQMAYSRKYLASFLRSNELFGDFPDVVLHPLEEPPVALNSEEALNTLEGSYGLTEEQRTALVGLESRAVHIEKDNIVFTVDFTRPIAPTLRMSVFVFGYRPDKPFAEMPKINVRVGGIRQAVFDQRKRLAPGSVSIDRGLKQLVIRIPRALLGGPDRLLTSVRTYLGTVPVDWVSWRAILLPTSS